MTTNTMKATPSNQALIAELNELRKAGGAEPIKFFGKRAELMVLVKAARAGTFETPTRKEPDPAVSHAEQRRREKFEAPAKEIKQQVVRPTVQKAEPLPTPHKPAKAAAAKPAAETKGQFTVAALCRSLGIDPKVGRAKCRRNADKLPPAIEKHTYASKHRAKVVAFLQAE